VPQASILKAGFIRFAPPDKTAIQELSHVGLDRNTEGRQSAGSELVTANHGHMARVTGGLAFGTKA
jgi:hypothetical protein